MRKMENIKIPDICYGLERIASWSMNKTQYYNLKKLVDNDQSDSNNKEYVISLLTEC